MDDGRRPRQKKTGSKLFMLFFWGTIITLAIIVMGIAGLAYLRTDNTTAESEIELPASEGPQQDVALEIEETTLQRIFERSANDAEKKTLHEIDPHLNKLFAPVYLGITRYADFHYTVLGEYTELVGAALGRVEREIERRLYGGFSANLDAVGKKIDERFAKKFRSALYDTLQAEIPALSAETSLAPATQLALDDALSRAQITVPVGAAMATVGGTTAIKALSSAIAAKISVKIAAKAAGKTVVKGTGIAGGAGLGALGGSWAGPIGMAVGGVGGGVATWFAVDAAVVSIDEYFNRDEFEADIRRMVDDHRRQIRLQLIRALEQKADDMKNFKLRDLSKN